MRHIDYLHVCLFVCFQRVFPLLGKKKKPLWAKSKQNKMQIRVTELFLSNRAGADPQDVLTSRVFLSKPGEKAGSSACMALTSCTWKYITNLFLGHHNQQHPSLSGQVSREWIWAQCSSLDSSNEKFRLSVQGREGRVFFTGRIHSA